MPIILKAKEMGYYVITTGNDPSLIGHQLADEYIKEDYSDKEAILQIVRDYKIDGIISCANDFGVITSAYVAEKMGWKGHDSYQNALLLHHKDKFKKYCKEHNIPSPMSEVFSDEQVAMDYLKGCKYPVIVKANDLTGGKGINKADNYTDAVDAVKIAFQMSRDKHIVIEPFISGTQHSICVFIVNKKIVVSSSCQSYSFINPYLIQAETFPSREVKGAVKKELERIINDMVADFDLADGIINLQLIMSGGKPYIIEMMRRSFGNDALLLYQQVTGFDWYKAYILSQLGEDCTSVKVGKSIRQYCGHYSVMSKNSGIIRKLTIDKKITDHVFKKLEMLHVNDKITNPNAERPIYLYYEYEDIENMNREIVQYNDWVTIEVD